MRPAVPAVLIWLSLALSACAFDRSGVPGADRAVPLADLASRDRAAGETTPRDAAAEASRDRGPSDGAPRETAKGDRGCIASTECGPDQVCSGGACTGIFGISYEITEVTATLKCVPPLTLDPAISLTINFTEVLSLKEMKADCAPHWTSGGKVGVINTSDLLTFSFTSSSVPFGVVLFNGEELKQGLHNGVLQGHDLVVVQSLIVKIVPQ